MSEEDKTSDAEDILSEFKKSHEIESSQQEQLSESKLEEEQLSESKLEEEQLSESKLEEGLEPQSEKESEAEISKETDGEKRQYNVIFIGTKPLMTYVTATLTQLASVPVVTITARGKRITQAIDVSQMIVKRMDEVGFGIGDVRISSDMLPSQDGRTRNVSSIEIDIKKL